MRGYSGSLPMDGSVKTPHLDITQPDGPVIVEFDSHRGVLYVHMEGVTVLRVCRISELRMEGTDSEPFKLVLTKAEPVEIPTKHTPHFFDPRD